MKLCIHLWSSTFLAMLILYQKIYVTLYRSEMWAQGPPVRLVLCVWVRLCQWWNTWRLGWSVASDLGIKYTPTLCWERKWQKRGRQSLAADKNSQDAKWHGSILLVSSNMGPFHSSQYELTMSWISKNYKYIIDPVCVCKDWNDAVWQVNTFWTLCFMITRATKRNKEISGVEDVLQDSNNENNI